jgi:hypothetical protein
MDPIWVLVSALLAVFGWVGYWASGQTGWRPWVAFLAAWTIGTGIIGVPGFAVGYLFGGRHRNIQLQKAARAASSLETC